MYVYQLTHCIKNVTGFLVQFYADSSVSSFFLDLESIGKLYFAITLRNVLSVICGKIVFADSLCIAALHFTSLLKQKYGY